MSLPRRRLPDAMRRGWCPGLARPMPTGDGLLARLHPPLGRLSAAQLRAVAEGARRFGNGHVDVTARANLQIRGLAPDTGPALAALLAGADLGDLRADGGPQRLTLTSPLAGLDPAAPLDVPALARAVEAAGRTIAGLPAKTLVAILGAGVPEAGADLVLVPIPRPTGAEVAVAFPGEAEALVVDAGEAAAAVAAILRAFAGSGRRRMRDLAPDARAAARAGLGPMRTRAADAGTLPLPLGPFEHAGRWLVALEAPFGRCRAADLDRLADLAEASGAIDAAAEGSLRLTPARGFVLVGAGAAWAAGAHDALDRAGFVTRAEDPRRAVAACPGAPACRSGSTPVPEDAARLAAAFAPFAARGLTAHVSGCAKGCARPGPADLTLVAQAGRYRIGAGLAPDAMADGTADGAAGASLTFETALERVRSADPGLPLGHAFRHERVFRDPPDRGKTLPPLD